jgi:hypothetical protein
MTLWITGIIGYICYNKINQLMENTITEITTGAIVLYDGGWYRVRKVG